MCNLFECKGIPSRLHTSSNVMHMLMCIYRSQQRFCLVVICAVVHYVHLHWFPVRCAVRPSELSWGCILPRELCLHCVFCRCLWYFLWYHVFLGSKSEFYLTLCNIFYLALSSLDEKRFKNLKMGFFIVQLLCCCNEFTFPLIVERVSNVIAATFAIWHLRITSWMDYYLLRVSEWKIL